MWLFICNGCQHPSNLSFPHSTQLHVGLCQTKKLRWQTDGIWLRSRWNRVTEHYRHLCRTRMMLDCSISALMDGSEHFPFLWPKYPADPYLVLPGGGCLTDLFPAFLLESPSWVFFSHTLSHLPPIPLLSLLPHTHLAVRLGSSAQRHKWCLPSPHFLIHNQSRKASF